MKSGSDDGEMEPSRLSQHSYPQYAFALGLLERLRLNGDERILDVGCGDGKVTAALAARVPRGSVLGIDASPDMIAFARTMFPESAHPNLSFRYGDAAKLTFRHEFDIVVAFASLHWVKDLPTALRGIKQSLAPVADLLPSSWQNDTPRQRSGRRCTEREKRSWTARRGERILRDSSSAGLTVPTSANSSSETPLLLRRCEFVTEEVTHQNADALKGYARSTWHRYTGRIPVQKRDALLNGVVQRCIELSPADRSGRIHVRGLARSRRNSLKRRIDCHSLLLNNSVANARKTEAKMRSATTSG